jgi:hypothetical protein
MFQLPLHSELLEAGYLLDSPSPNMLCPRDATPGHHDADAHAEDFDGSVTSRTRVRSYQGVPTVLGPDSHRLH